MRKRPQRNDKQTNKSVTITMPNPLSNVATLSVRANKGAIPNVQNGYATLDRAYFAPVFSLLPTSETTKAKFAAMRVNPAMASTAAELLLLAGIHKAFGDKFSITGRVSDNCISALYAPELNLITPKAREDYMAANPSILSLDDCYFAMSCGEAVIPMVVGTDEDGDMTIVSVKGHTPIVSVSLATELMGTVTIAVGLVTSPVKGVKFDIRVGNHRDKVPGALASDRHPALAIISAIQGFANAKDKAAALEIVKDFVTPVRSGGGGMYTTTFDKLPFGVYPVTSVIREKRSASKNGVMSSWTNTVVKVIGPDGEVNVRLAASASNRYLVELGSFYDIENIDDGKAIGVVPAFDFLDDNEGSDRRAFGYFGKEEFKDKGGEVRTRCETQLIPHDGEDFIPATGTWDPVSRSYDGSAPMVPAVVLSNSVTLANLDDPDSDEDTGEAEVFASIAKKSATVDLEDDSEFSDM